jgi:hypothetical protein
LRRISAMSTRVGGNFNPMSSIDLTFSASAQDMNCLAKRARR